MRPAAQRRPAAPERAAGDLSGVDGLSGRPGSGGEAGLISSPASAGSPMPGGAHLVVSERQRVDLDAWLGRRGLTGMPLIAIQMGNKRTMRRGCAVWRSPQVLAERALAEVLRHVRGQCPGHAVVLLGTGPEYALNREVAALAGVPGLHNAADDLPIPRLVALLAQADGLITVDSGPAHAAAAVGCPEVVLFGKDRRRCTGLGVRPGRMSGCCAAKCGRGGYARNRRAERDRSMVGAETTKRRASGRQSRLLKRRSLRGARLHARAPTR